MLVLRTTGYKEASPFNNFSVLKGKGEHIGGDENFDYVIEIPGEEHPCLLTECGLWTTLHELRTSNPLVGKFHITPLHEDPSYIPVALRTPQTTMTVDKLFKIKAQISKAAEIN